MILEESTTASAIEEAEGIVSEALKNVKNIQDVVDASKGCLSSAFEEAGKTREEIQSQRENLKPVASSIVSRVKSQVSELGAQLKEQAQKEGEAIGPAARRVAEESIAAGLGTSTGRIGQIASNRVEESVTEEIDEVYGEGTARALRRKGNQARKAAVAGLDIIANNYNAFFRGVMGLLVRRTERDLRRMEENLRQIQANARRVRRGADVARRARDLLTDEGQPLRIQQAAELVGSGRRDVSVARDRYDRDQFLNKSAVEDASEKFSDASQLLSSSRATALLNGLLEEGLLEEGLGNSSSVSRLESARDAVTEITAAPIASLYGQVLTWSGLARTLSDTAGPALSVAQLVKTGQTLRYIENEAELLKVQIDNLRPSEAGLRAEIAANLQTLSRKLAALEKTAQQGDDINEKRWYQRALSFFRRPFFTDRTEEGPIQRLEVFERLAQSSAEIAGLRSESGGAVEAATRSLDAVRELRIEASRLSDLAQQSNIVSVVSELLATAGIESPIDSILRGEFSQEVRAVFAGASTILPDTIEKVCPDSEDVLPSDREQAYMEAKRRMREQNRAATDSIAAIAESDATDAQRTAGLPK